MRSTTVSPIRSSPIRFSPIRFSPIRFSPNRFSPIVRTLSAFASALLLALPLGCDAEPERELEEPRVEPDEDLDDADDPGLDGAAADELAAPLDPAAISPGFEIEIEIVGDDVVLTWPQIEDAAQYGIYDAEGPYFTPPPYGTYGTWYHVGMFWANVGPHQFVHEGAAATADTHYYRVVAWNYQGYVRGYSATAVKLAQPLVTGANMVTQPLLDATVDDAESLHAALGGLPGPLGRLSRWDAPTQSFQDWDPWSGQPGFAIEPGDALFVHTHGPGLLVTTGYAPAESGDVVHELSPGWNLVSTPMGLNPPFWWANPGIPASEVASTLGNAVQQLSEWDPATQSFATYLHPQGWGTDFTVENHQALWVQTNALVVWD